MPSPNAPSSAARCEIDLSGGAAIVPDKAAAEPKWASTRSATQPASAIGATSCPSPATTVAAWRASSRPPIHSEIAPVRRSAAGNRAEVGQAFQYDATAPKLPMAKAAVEKGVAKIVWKRSPDAVLVELERTPGVNGRKKTIVYRGSGASFTDRTVRGGVRYRYEIRASDAAGNMVEKAVTANVDLPALYRPTAGATVRAPLVLSWEPVKGATFYNVQLYRNKVKVLTFWPEKPTFRAGQLKGRAA